MTDELPSGLQLTALDPEFRADPYPRLKLLREQKPFRRDAMFGSVGLMRYADVRATLTDRTLWRDPLKADETCLPHRRAVQQAADGAGPPSILTIDDPDHGRVRGLITPVLYTRFAASRAMVDQVVRSRLDQLEGQDPFDLIKSFAIPIPIEVIAHTLGVDATRLDEFRTWSEAIVHTFNPIRTPEQTAEMTAAGQALGEYLAQLMRERRAAPRDDLVSDLVALQADGGEISDDEIRVNCNTLLIAGNLTTSDLIGAGVRLLLSHPDQLEKLRADPGLISATVEEILRFDPPVDSTLRVASRDLEIGGCPVRPREPISASLRSANRDEAVFPNADQFDITRERTPHMAFGGGAHICLGAPLARMEAQSAFLGLFSRFPKLRLGDEAPQWRALPFFRGMETLILHPN